jgi:hypothetical protein
MRLARYPAAPAEADAPWILARGERRDPSPGWRVGGYVGLWLRGRFEGFDGARDLAAMGLDAAAGPRAPAARIVLVPEEGEPVELVVSDVDDRRRARVWNVRTNVVGIVPGEIQPLLAPRAELFLDTTRPNPWEAWLRKR